MNFDRYYGDPTWNWPEPLTAGEYRQMLRERGRMFELDGFCDAEGRAGVAMIGGSPCLPRNKRALRIRDRVFRRLTADVRRSRRRDARLAAAARFAVRVQTGRFSTRFDCPLPFYSFPSIMAGLPSRPLDLSGLGDAIKLAQERGVALGMVNTTHDSIEVEVPAKVEVPSGFADAMKAELSDKTLLNLLTPDYASDGAAAFKQALEQRSQTILILDEVRLRSSTAPSGGVVLSDESHRVSPRKKHGAD